MKIAVTFEGIPELSDGTRIVFDDVHSYELGMPHEVETVSCEAAACGGCTVAHHRFTGLAHLNLSAAGTGKGPQWELPGEAAR